MGIWDAFSEIVEAVTPWSVVEAEAPAEEPKVRKVPLYRAIIAADNSARATTCLSGLLLQCFLGWS
jgi:hypothetical protein